MAYTLGISQNCHGTIEMFNPRCGPTHKTFRQETSVLNQSSEA